MKLNIPLFSRRQANTAQTAPKTSKAKLLLAGWLCLELLSLPIAGLVLAQKLSGDTEAGYLIRGGDKLSVKFPYHPELNEPSLAVRPDGYITLALVGEVRASGLTVPQLKQQLEKEYGEMLVNPVISINLTDFVMARVFVGGQVNKAGSYELRAGQTLLQAVMLAGGFTNDANRKLVVHARPVGDGKLHVTQHNVLEMLSQGKAAHDFPLQDGDYVFVPNSKLSTLARALDAFRAVIPGAGLIF